jgi:ABC-type molybdenum transport system ATPase subunit/photorepair protein PhrA
MNGPGIPGIIVADEGSPTMSPHDKSARRARPLAVHVDDVAVRLGDALAVARVTFRVPAGGSVALTGSNGSGNTTWHL